MQEDNTISQDNEEPFTVFDQLPENEADTVLDYAIPSVDDIQDDIALNEFDPNSVIDPEEPEFGETAVSDEEVSDEGSTIIEDKPLYNDYFEKQNEKEIKNKAKEIEKDIPLTKVTKKEINDKIINDAKEGIAGEDLKSKQKAYEAAKKPTKYEKEARKAAGLSDYEAEYNKMSNKEKKHLEEEIDKIIKEEEEAGEAKRKKEADKERVSNFFKPLQYERKVFANGRSRVLPKGTFMSPDGTEYYNPETETIEQVVEETPNTQEPVEEKEAKDNKGGSSVGEAIKNAATENVGYNLWDTIIKS